MFVKVNSTFHNQCVESGHAAQAVRCDTHVDPSVGGRGLADGQDAPAPPCGVHHVCSRAEDPLDLRGRVGISEALQEDTSPGGHLHGEVTFVEAWSICRPEEEPGSATGGFLDVWEEK